MKAGMNVARFNFSHGSYEEHHDRIQCVRRIAAELDMTIGILLDTNGSTRTGLLKDHQKVSVKAGDKIVVTAAPTSEDFLGDASHISLDYLNLPNEVEPGSRILIDDGIVELEVESVEGQDMHCVVKNDGEIGERKGVNLPNVEIGLPAITERDRQDILFGLKEGIDYIAASFIRNGAAVREIRELCRENGGEHVGIFPKIECALGVQNFDEILKASDGIMVARGDLGIEIAPELVPHLQKKMIKKCNAAYKPVITATQMLDSMIRNPRPTRAEVADVANAIYDGTDAVMLSGESAAGKYPVEAVRMQASIAHETEQYLGLHAELKVPEGSQSTRVINNVVGQFGREHGHHRGREVHHLPHHHRPHGASHLSLPSCGAGRGVLPPPVGGAEDAHVLGHRAAPRRHHPRQRRRYRRHGNRICQGARLCGAGRCRRRDRGRPQDRRRVHARRRQAQLHERGLRRSGALSWRVVSQIEALGSMFASNRPPTRGRFSFLQALLRQNFRISTVISASAE